MFGIRGSEVLEFYHLSDAPSMGIFFNDPIITKYREIAFDALWGRTMVEAEKVSAPQERLV